MTRPPANRYFAFGPYVLDRLRGVLWHGGAVITLTPRVFEVLATLVEHAGSLVTKDDFARLVWNGAIVEDNNLARHISTLRKALHETPGRRDYIVTIPGVGYRFVAEVTMLEALPPATGPDPNGDQSLPAEPLAAGEAAAPPSAIPPLPVWPARPATVVARWGWLTAFVFVALLATAALWRYRPQPEPVQRSLWQFAYADARDPAWSPDGTQIAYASNRNGSSGIWLQTIGGASPTRVTSSPAPDSQPSWSPDGRWLVFRSERDGGGLYVVRASGGAEERLVAFGTRPRWSPSGRWILFASASIESANAVKMYVVDRESRSPRLLDAASTAGLSVRSAAWHPDGRVTFWGRTSDGARAMLTAPVDGTDAPVRSHIDAAADRRIADADVDLTNFVWAPSGRYLYFEGRSQLVRSLWRVTVDPATLAWIAGPERLTTGPGTDGSPSISPDGTRMAYEVSSSRVEMWAFDFDPATGQVKGSGERITSGDGIAAGADASPDGQRIVYRTVRSDRQEIWEQSASQPPRLLLSTPDWNQSVPRWSPDGTRVVYQRSRGRGDEVERAVAILAVDKAEEEIITRPGAAEIIPTSWSSNGRSILAGCRLAPGEPIGICAVSLPARKGDECEVQRLTSDPRMTIFQQRFSPNDRWISFMAVPIGDRSVSTIHVMRAAGGAWTPVTDGTSYDDKPRWSPDGRTLYFVSNRSGRSEVWGRRFDPIAGQPLGDPFRVVAPDESRYALSPYVSQMELSIAASRIVLPLYEPSGRIWMLDQIDK